MRDLVGREMVSDERCVDLVLGCIADIVVRERGGGGAIGHDRDLGAAHFISIPAGVLFLGERGCGLHSWDGKGRQRGSGRCSCE